MLEPDAPPPHKSAITVTTLRQFQVRELSRTVDATLKVEEGGLAVWSPQQRSGPTLIPYESLVCYETRRVKDVGPEWELSLQSVAWKYYLVGKTVTQRVFQLLVPPEFLVPEDGPVDPAGAYAAALVRLLDKAVLRWMRTKSGVVNKSLAVSSVSLLRPQSGVEAALFTIKRESESDDSSVEQAGLALRELSVESDRKQSNISNPAGATRKRPGEYLFCDEEALSVPGLVVERQTNFFGLRCVGSWAVWKTGAVSVLVSQELIPALLVLSPIAIVMMLPTASMFSPFPLECVAGWGASNDSFSFRYKAAEGVFNVITFNSNDAPQIETRIAGLVDTMMAGGVALNPIPLYY